MNDQGIKYDDRVAKAVEKRELLKRTPLSECQCPRRDASHPEERDI